MKEQCIYLFHPFSPLAGAIHRERTPKFYMFPCWRQLGFEVFLLVQPRESRSGQVEHHQTSRQEDMSVLRGIASYDWIMLKAALPPG